MRYNICHSFCFFPVCAEQKDKKSINRSADLYKYTHNHTNKRNLKNKGNDYNIGFPTTEVPSLTTVVEKVNLGELSVDDDPRLRQDSSWKEVKTLLLGIDDGDTVICT